MAARSEEFPNFKVSGDKFLQNFGIQYNWDTDNNVSHTILAAYIVFFRIRLLLPDEYKNSDYTS